MKPALYTTDPGAGFLETIARDWLEACGDDPIRSGDGLILLPTRRGVRALTDAFLRVCGHTALLLPRIDAIGGPDEAPLAIAGGLDVPPAIGRLARQAALARLILARPHDAPPTLAAAMELAASLADLIDEAARWEIDLPRALPSLAPDTLASHWQVTLEFLSIVTELWPAALAATGQTDPAVRQVALLRAQIAAWTAEAPAHPVWLAGVIAASPAECDLARVVSRLPHGRVVLPGLDLDLPDPFWDVIGDAHPQAGLKRFLADLGATRGDAVRLPGSGDPARAGLLRRAMLPEAAVAATWREPAALDPAGLSLIAAPDQQSEAVAIALALRETLETPGRTAALVTPDRTLATRVVAELDRFGIIADDSAGEPLAQTPPATFLRLIASTVAEDFPPATLLALLKHPFAAAGLTPAECRRQARALEIACLRGPRLADGLTGLRAAAAGKEPVTGFIARLETCLAPLTAHRRQTAPAILVAALLETAERLADPAQLWSGEEGEALAAHMAELADALAPLAPTSPDGLPELLDASLDGVAVHGRRALRGSGAAELHPRVAIWGLLEARGQTADRLVLAGLTEGIWPPATDPGPWMGRPMRAAVGLPSPEIAVGAAAHDFTMLACAAPDVVLSFARRRDHAPAVPSRWIARLEACLAGLCQTLPAHPALAWAASLDQPDGAPQPAKPPRPRPPVARRPRRLSVTEIESWLRDPYAIYARHVLRVRPLAELEEEADHALFGNLVHDGLAHAYGAGRIDEAGLADAFETALGRLAVRPGIAAWWRPRLARIAAWVAETEAARVAAAPVEHRVLEIKGSTTLRGPAGPFELTGRADRIERRAGAIAILDYKTGTVPAHRLVLEGWSPQLPLEATMATLGAFGDAFRGLPTGELAYWKLSGGTEPGKEASLVKRDEIEQILGDVWHGLECRIEEFDDPETAYLAQPWPAHAPAYDNYGVLARVTEWRVTDKNEP